MIQFLDSSAFVKMFLDEPASGILRDHLRYFTDDAKVSMIAQVEARSAIERRRRNRELGLNAARRALSDLEEVSALWVRVHLTDRVINLTTGVITRHALRPLDALQLASALALREELDGTEDLLSSPATNACSQPLP